MPYAFTIEDYAKFSEDIIKAGGDQATLTSLLADMQGTYTDAVAKDIATSEKLTTVSAENERLKTANMDLFLRVGSKVAEDAGVLPKTQAQEEQPIKGTAEYISGYLEKLKKEK